MALYRYFKTADSVLPAPTGSLSTSISPAVIKDANEAVKSAVTPRSKSRGAYAKHTPEQQAAIGKYASTYGSLSPSPQQKTTLGPLGLPCFSNFL